MILVSDQKDDFLTQYEHFWHLPLFTKVLKGGGFHSAEQSLLLPYFLESISGLIDVGKKTLVHVLLE